MRVGLGSGHVSPGAELACRLFAVCVCRMCLQDVVGHGEASFVALHVFNLVFVAFMLMIVADRSCV